MHAVSELSYTIDAFEPFLATANQRRALVADPAKLMHLFTAALDDSPDDCLIILRLAARSTASATIVPPLLQLLSARLHRLLRGLTDHLRNQRQEPLSAKPPQGLMHQLTTLGAALDAAPPLECASHPPHHASPNPNPLAGAFACRGPLSCRSSQALRPRCRTGRYGTVRLCPQEWLREQLELFVDAHVPYLLFPNAASPEPQAPTAALGLLTDLGHAVATLTPYTNLDLQAMIDSVLARELGDVQVCACHSDCHACGACARICFARWPCAVLGLLTRLGASAASPRTLSPRRPHRSLHRCLPLPRHARRPLHPMLQVLATDGAQLSAVSEGRTAIESGVAVRAQGTTVDAAAAAAKRARGVSLEVLSTRAGAPSADAPPARPSPPKLLDRLGDWLSTAVQAAQRPDGPKYVPGRRAFTPGHLDASQFAALVTLIGAGGASRLDALLLQLCAEPPSSIAPLLLRYAEPLAAVAGAADADVRLPAEGAEDVPSPAELGGLLQRVRSFGVALVVRSLFHEGVRRAKASILPAAIMAFVAGLGEQQLPDGTRAGQRLQPATALLSAHGLLGGMHADAALAEAVAARCADLREGRSPKEVGEAKSGWCNLPYALAMIWSLPDWGSGAHGVGDGHGQCLVSGQRVLLVLPGRPPAPSSETVALTSLRPLRANASPAVPSHRRCTGSMCSFQSRSTTCPGALPSGRRCHSSPTAAS